MESGSMVAKISSGKSVSAKWKPMAVSLGQWKFGIPIVMMVAQIYTWDQILYILKSAYKNWWNTNKVCSLANTWHQCPGFDNYTVL